jgi:hypothetical protein
VRAGDFALKLAPVWVTCRLQHCCIAGVPFGPAEHAGRKCALQPIMQRFSPKLHNQFSLIFLLTQVNGLVSALPSFGPPQDALNDTGTAFLTWCGSMSRSTRVVFDTSRVTRHTSHLTPHTSHLTPHTSHLTPRTPHVTRHTSHIPQVGHHEQWLHRLLDVTRHFIQPQHIRRPRR